MTHRVLKTLQKAHSSHMKIFIAFTFLLLLQTAVATSGALPPTHPEKTALSLPRRGIPNVGATCYFNTATQSINALPKLVHIILQADALLVAESDAREALLGLQTLLYMLNFWPSSSSLPSNYVQWFVAKVTSLFKCGWTPFDQNASDEYFVRFLNLLTETLLSNEPGLVTELNKLLQIQLVSSIDGASPGKTEYTYFLPVSLVDSTIHTLEQALEKYTAIQDVADYGPTKRTAKKQLQIKCAPPVLALYLNRFTSHTASKDPKKVSFPETLNLSPYMYDSSHDTSTSNSSKPTGGKMDYFLVGASEHIGTTVNSAHYTFYRRPDPEAKPSEWYSFNDTSVNSINSSAAMNSLFEGSSTATMLFYVRSDQLGPVLNPTDFKPSDGALTWIEGELANLSARQYTAPYTHYDHSSGSSSNYTPSKTYSPSTPSSSGNAPSQTPMTTTPSEGASPEPATQPPVPASSDQTDTRSGGNAHPSIFSIGNMQGFWDVLGKPLIVAGCVLGFAALVVIVPAAIH